jgi:hypothetical protein
MTKYVKHFFPAFPLHFRQINRRRWRRGTRYRLEATLYRAAAAPICRIYPNTNAFSSYEYFFILRISFHQTNIFSSYIKRTKTRQTVSFYHSSIFFVGEVRLADRLPPTAPAKPRYFAVHVV